MTWTSRRIRNSFATLTAVMAAVALTGCGSTASGGSTGAAAEQTITLGLPVPATTLASVYLAIDKDLWKAQNLKVKVVTFKGDADLAKAVLAGSVDVALGSLVGPLTVVAAGQDAKVIYGGFNMPGFSWWAVPSIHTVAEGKGQTWGVTTLGSSTDFLTRYAVAKSGLDPKKDIKVVQGGPSGPRLAAMKAGQIKVNIFTEPYTLKAPKLGYNLILDLKDLVPTYPMHVLWSTPKFTSDGDVAKRFIAGLSAGMTMTKSDPDAAAQSVSKANKIPLEDAKASVNKWLDQLYPDGRLPTAKDLDAFWQMGIDGGVFKTRIPDSKWLNPTFMPKGTS